jgi:hypothetical protein
MSAQYKALEIERRDVSKAWVLVPIEKYERYPEDTDRWGDCISADNNYEGAEFEVTDEEHVFVAPDELSELSANQGDVVIVDWEFVKSHRAEGE